MDLLQQSFSFLGTIRRFLATSRCLPLHVLLLFSTSLVGELWICNCLEQFLWLGPFGSMWSFLWTFSQVLVHIVSICSFLVLVYGEWRWISLTRTHVFYHDLSLSTLIFFSVLLSSPMCNSAFGASSSTSSFLVILFINSTCSLCFFGCHNLLQNRLVSFASGCGHVFCHALPVVDRIVFFFFAKSSFFCFALPFVDISLISLLSPVLSGLFHVVLLFFLLLSFPFCSHILKDLSFLSSYWSIFVDFLSAFPLEFRILVLTASSCFLRRSHFSHTKFAPI